VAAGGEGLDGLQLVRQHSLAEVVVPGKLVGVQDGEVTVLDADATDGGTRAEFVEFRDVTARLPEDSLPSRRRQFVRASLEVLALDVLHQVERGGVLVVVVPVAEHPRDRDRGPFADQPEEPWFGAIDPGIHEVSRRRLQDDRPGTVGRVDLEGCDEVRPVGAAFDGLHDPRRFDRVDHLPHGRVGDLGVERRGRLVRHDWTLDRPAGNTLGRVVAISHAGARLSLSPRLQQFKYWAARILVRLPLKTKRRHVRP
jgi:hypothetical protein